MTKQLYEISYSFEMYFDENSENKLKNMFQDLASLGAFPAVLKENRRYHITLAIYDSIDFEKSKKALEKFCMSHNQFKLNLDFIGLFTGKENVIFASPMITNDLIKIHQDFHKEFSWQKKLCWEHYIPESWQPHCSLTVTTQDAQFPEVLQIIRNKFRPIDVKIKSIGFTFNGEKVNFNLKE
jgi:2'-5' RNA ligase